MTRNSHIQWFEIGFCISAVGLSPSAKERYYIGDISTTSRVVCALEETYDLEKVRRSFHTRRCCCFSLSTSLTNDYRLDMLAKPL